MAVDVCTDSPSLSTSPRISFSYDLHENETDESSILKDLLSQSDNDSDFDFCIAEVVPGNEPSPADQLFSDGQIRPLQLHQKFMTSRQIPLSKPQSLSANDRSSSKKETLESLMAASPETDPPIRPPSKSFWRIGRSSSLNCENAHKKTSSIWSLPLLSRSNSTGSVPNSKLGAKESQKLSNSSQKHARNSAPTSSSSLSSSSSFGVSNFSQKPPLKKDYGNGVRVSPVLNLPPPPYICTGSLGLSSLFGSNGKEKKIKK